MLFKLLNVFDHQDHQKNVKTAQGTITADHWFDDRVGIRLPFYRRNEVESEKFSRKLNSYTRLRVSPFLTNTQD